MGRLSEFSDELQALVARTAPAVVGVVHARGQGSGVVLAGDGYVVTNAHVVGPAGPELWVHLGGGEAVRARRVGTDPQSDLALLRVESGDLASLPLAADEELNVGQLVVAIGNPFHLHGSVSIGVVSALDRTLPNASVGLLEGLVQTDAAINPGNSGGPLLDVEGRVVGINTAIIPFAQGIGFAIPARTVNWVVALLLQKGEIHRPWLGIAARGEQLPPPLAAEAGQPRAVRVLEIGADSPAHGAGLRPGDLILAANARTVRYVDDLQRELVLSPEPAVRLSVLRDRQRRLLTARPTARPAAA
jgi:serine protease Do